ncbi:hypothetical protein EDD18DRAFT_1332575 [Armillaria luteobubalina]|uniref:Uncharacterized protein n=1 Tax=Armillaria luteobubalina TaxID=153913 RepID=A0AA39Q3Z1_9AGAR|nr:hypothetical protein EDD18DRAFT_1332575 [Armillaria luteobubalina]
MTLSRAEWQFLQSVYNAVNYSKDPLMEGKGHNIHVGPSIQDKREYLYYFIGNCNVAQQEALRNEGISRYRQTEQLCTKLCTPLLILLLKTNHPDVSMPRQP